VRCSEFLCSRWFVASISETTVVVSSVDVGEAIAFLREKVRVVS